MSSNKKIPLFRPYKKHGQAWSNFYVQKVLIFAMLFTLLLLALKARGEVGNTAWVTLDGYYTEVHILQKGARDYPTFTGGKIPYEVYEQSFCGIPIKVDVREIKSKYVWRYGILAYDVAQSEEQFLENGELKIFPKEGMRHLSLTLIVAVIIGLLMGALMLMAVMGRGSSLFSEKNLAITSITLFATPLLSWFLLKEDSLWNMVGYFSFYLGAGIWLGFLIGKIIQQIELSSQKRKLYTAGTK